MDGEINKNFVVCEAVERTEMERARSDPTVLSLASQVGYVVAMGISPKADVNAVISWTRYFGGRILSIHWFMRELVL